MQSIPSPVVLGAGTDTPRHMSCPSHQHAIHAGCEYERVVAGNAEGNNPFFLSSNACATLFVQKK